METRAGASLWQAVRDAAHQFGLRTFWRWWVGELAPLVPARLRNVARHRRMRPMIAFGEDTAVLWVPRITDGRLGFEEAARIPLSTDPGVTASAGRAAISALPRVAYGGPVAEAKVVVALPESQMLRKTITLPAAIEADLAQALAFDLDRHTPFKPDELYFDAVVVGRDSARKEIRVDMAAALRATVDVARRRAESWGSVVVGVTSGSADGGAAFEGTTLNLLPVADRPDASAWRRPEFWVPLALIALLAVAVIALPVWQKRGYAIALMQFAQQGRVQAEASSALRAQLEQLTGDYNFALQKKYAFPSAVQVVEDVTKLLPDDTWLTQFEVKSSSKGKEPSREILLRGESANAGRLISLLEDSKLFEQAAPRSPTTKIQPGPGEIFDLGAQLKPLPPPATVPAPGVTSSSPPAPGPAMAPPAPGPAASPPGQPAPGGAPAPPGSGAAPASPMPGAAPAAPTPGAAVAPAMPGPAPLIAGPGPTAAPSGPAPAVSAAPAAKPSEAPAQAPPSPAPKVAQ